MNTKFMTLCFLLITYTSTAQNSTEKEQKIHFGLSLGVNHSHILDDYNQPMIVVNDFGFRFGALATYTVNNTLSITGRTELSFSNGLIYKDIPRLFPIYQEILPISNEFILHAEFSDKKGKLYALVGPNYKLAIPNKTRFSNQFVSNSDLAIDVGTGINLPLGGFIISPQIRYSFGLYGISADPSFPSSTFNNVAFVVSFR